MTEDPRAFLDLVTSLEVAVGTLGYYPVLEPFACHTLIKGMPAIIEIQTAGKKIAQHVGLGDLTFIIAVTSQGPTTAGHIELTYGKPEVYVEISQDICGYKDSVLATLSHEIAHKFLHRHGIDKGMNGLELEFLTDVTSVYLGMGKIMLNGCECQSSRTTSGGGKTTTTTHSLKTGYISRSCFAFVYRVICEMRRLPKSQMMTGLSAPARQAVLECERTYSDWFRPEYREAEGIQHMTNALYTTIADAQKRGAEKDHSLRNAQQHLVTLRAALNAVHAPLSEARSRIAGMVRPENNRMGYLNFVGTRHSVTELVFQSENRLKALDPGWRQLNDLTASATDESPQHVVVECPIDSTKLRLPSGKKSLLVTCPSCKYEFIVTTLDVKRPSRLQELRAKVLALFVGP